jgi:hypothetical protein
MVFQTDTAPYQKWLDPNGGFYFVRASNATLHTFQILQQYLLVHPEFEDQQGLSMCLKSPSPI